MELVSKLALVSKLVFIGIGIKIGTNWHWYQNSDKDTSLNFQWHRVPEHSRCVTKFLYIQIDFDLRLTFRLPFIYIEIDAERL